MSRKWQRSKRWDDEHIPTWAWPVKAVLRAFSSIWLAVILLSFVLVYAILASVPIGLLVLAVTYVFYGVTLLGVALIVSLPLTVVVWLSTKRIAWSTRFIASSLVFVGFTALGVVLWRVGVWPALAYDATTDSGVRFFADFVQAYESTTLRRLPGVELTEIEFYSAWPLRLVLFAFVANMVVATVRRIEFIFPNIGVLTVHTGIVVMALGSIYYAGLKQEGLAILRAGELNPQTGAMTIGPPTTSFYDHIDVALYLDQGALWEQRVVEGVPRYNDYNLEVGAGDSLNEKLGTALAPPASNGPLSIQVPEGSSDRVDPSLDFEIVGYASYAEPVVDWVKAPAPPTGAHPVQVVHILAPEAEDEGQVRPAFSFALHPTDPALRATANGVFDVEYRVGMSDERWRDVTTDVPEGARHVMIVEIPEIGYRDVYPVEIGRTIEVGETGYTITPEQTLPEPPFPIITPGYEGATSAVAVLNVTKPDGSELQRWAYHRFPEISQDFSQPDQPGMRPQRGPADPSIEITYLDESHPQIYLDERPDGTIRAALHDPRNGVRVVEDIGASRRIEDIFQRQDASREPLIDLQLGDHWAHARQVTRPRVVPVEERNPQLVGTHDMAMVAVKVSQDDWSETVWVPTTGFPLARFGGENEVTVNPPRSPPVRMLFGARQRPLPGFAIELVDFEMIAYDHRGAPRDYQSTVHVKPVGDTDFEAYTHLAKLNAPLQAPFMWSEDRSLIANVVGKLSSRLNPNQFKLSQARWDAGGWEQTQQLADQGQLPRPFARWTILGVGNNPGIHIIALGSILVGIGTPWAFYVKPLIMRARKRKLQAAIAETTSEPSPDPKPEPVGAES